MVDQDVISCYRHFIITVLFFPTACIVLGIALFGPASGIANLAVEETMIFFTVGSGIEVNGGTIIEIINSNVTSLGTESSDVLNDVVITSPFDQNTTLLFTGTLRLAIRVIPYAYIKMRERICVCISKAKYTNCAYVS